jgi:hypothetical protein
MFKKIMLLLIVCFNILFLILGVFTMGLSSEEARQLNDIVDEKDNAVLAKLSNWDISATVVSVGNGSAVVHLPTDPTGNLTVQNPNEISLEVGDQVTIHKTNGNINNAVVLFRKTVNFNDIYVDYNTGTDAFGRDASGNQYGSEDAPFKTLQYAVNRLPKNLNGRIINIYFNTLDYSEILFVDGFSGGGELYITPYDGITPASIYAMLVKGCVGILFETQYLSFSTASDLGGVYPTNVRIIESNYVTIRHAVITDNNASALGFAVVFGSNATIDSCTISNHWRALYITSTSIVLSQNNNGTGNNVGLRALYGSTICKDGTQPNGTTPESSDSSSVIR